MKKTPDELIKLFSKQLFIDFSEQEIVILKEEFKILEKQLAVFNKINLDGIKETYTVNSSLNKVPHFEYENKENIEDLINTFPNKKNGFLKINDK